MPDQWWDALKEASNIITVVLCLIFFIFACYRRWIVFGWVFDMKAAECETWMAKHDAIAEKLERLLELRSDRYETHEGNSSQPDEIRPRTRSRASGR